MQTVAGEVRCMLVPMHEARLLVPNAAVAEVIGYREPTAADDLAGGVLGVVAWRQRDIPVLDFERFLGGSARAGGVRQRIVVCYLPSAKAGWPVVGLVSQGIPRLLRVDEAGVDYALRPLRSDSGIRMRISINDEEFIVPDLPSLHERIGQPSTAPGQGGAH